MFFYTCDYVRSERRRRDLGEQGEAVSEPSWRVGGGLSGPRVHRKNITKGILLYVESLNGFPSSHYSPYLVCLVLAPLDGL